MLNTTYYKSGDPNNGQTSINIYQKFDASVADIGGSVTNYGPGKLIELSITINI